MAVLYFILPLALFFALGAVVAFIWAVKRGQYDDLESPPRRVLFENERPEAPARPIHSSTSAAR